MQVFWLKEWLLSLHLKLLLTPKLWCLQYHHFLKHLHCQLHCWLILFSLLCLPFHKCQQPPKMFVKKVSSLLHFPLHFQMSQNKFFYLQCYHAKVAQFQYQPQWRILVSCFLSMNNCPHLYHSNLLWLYIFQHKFVYLSRLCNYLHLSNLLLLLLDLVLYRCWMGK